MSRVKGRTIALALLALFGMFVLIVIVAHAAGVRINTTGSFPRGIYIVKHGPIKRGDLVEFYPPDTEVFRMAVDRGYIHKDWLWGNMPLLKRVVAIAGDSATINSRGVTVNGTYLPNSRQATKDDYARPLPNITVKNYRLQAGEILLMSEYSPWSFDGRYCGIQRVDHLR